MKKIETLTGKNLPRLAVAKPGWPEPCTVYVPPSTMYQPPSTITFGGGRSSGKSAKLAAEKAIADFTRVCDQTGLSEKLRKD